MIEKTKDTVLASLPMDFKECFIHFIYLGGFLFNRFFVFYECMATCFVVYFPNTLEVLMYVLCTGGPNNPLLLCQRRPLHLNIRDSESFNGHYIYLGSGDCRWHK